MQYVVGPKGKSDPSNFQYGRHGSHLEILVIAFSLEQHGVLTWDMASNTYISQNQTRITM